MRMVTVDVVILYDTNPRRLYARANKLRRRWITRKRGNHAIVDDQYQARAGNLCRWVILTARIDE